MKFNSTPKNYLCPHFKECSGCSAPLSYEPPPVWSEVLTFFKDSVIPTLHQGPPIQWRHRAKVAVRGTPNNPLIGLFKRGSHEVSPIPECLVHHPHLNRAFEIIRNWIKQHQLIPYQENTGHGDLRYVQGVVERSTGQVQLTFVLNTPHQETPKAVLWHNLLSQLEKEYPDLWHSLWLNFNNKPTNTIFGPHWLQVSGKEWIWEAFDGIDVCYGAASFGQANLPLFERMLIRLRDLLPQKACVAEFYAGVGAIGLFIAPHCQWVRCSEINPYAEICFERSKTRLDCVQASKLTFCSSSAKESLSTLERATTVIVDPPRKGLDPSFLSALQSSPSVEQLIYVSCGWESFKRDCEQLHAQQWTISSVDGYLFFPGSNHVELLVNFERK